LQHQLCRNLARPCFVAESDCRVGEAVDDGVQEGVERRNDLGRSVVDRQLRDALGQDQLAGEIQRDSQARPRRR
jgi:hypothetical protein